MSDTKGLPKVNIMQDKVIIKTGSSQAVQSALVGLEVLWIRDLGNGNVAAAVSLPVAK